MSTKDLVESIFQKESNAIASIPKDQEFASVVELLYEKIHKKGGKGIVSGMGKAGQVANNIATTMSSTGSPGVFLHPSEAQHGDLGIICKNDVLIVLSNSGKTREIIELVQLTKKMYDEIPLILITGNRESVLAKVSDYVIFTGKPEEVCPLKLTPTTSTTVMMVIGDAITVLLMKRIGFTREEYAKRHHGGYIGQKIRKD